MFHTFNINKLLEMIFIAKIKYYNKPKVFILITYIYIHTIILLKKLKKNIFMIMKIETMQNMGKIKN